MASKILAIRKTSLAGGGIEKEELFEMCIIEREIDFGMWSIENHALVTKEIVVEVVKQFLEENIKPMK